MERSELTARPPVIDLLYPSEEKRCAMIKRRNDLSERSGSLSRDMMLDAVGKLLCPNNAYKMCTLLQELPDDREVIEYRQDILCDLMNVKGLPAMLKRVIDTMLTGDKRGMYKLSEPDTFTSLNTAVEAFEAYIECMELVRSFDEKHRAEVTSAGIKKLLDHFAERYADKHYRKLCEDIKELRKRMDKRIRSITVAINLDENMVPSSAGIVDISDEPYTPKPSVLERIIYRGAKFSENVFADNIHERYIFEGGDRFSKDRILNDVEKPLFEDLDHITWKYVRLIEQALSEYQAIGFDEVKSIDYQLDIYLGVLDLMRTAENKGLKMCRPKLLPACERRGRIKGVFDLVYFSEANLHNLRSKDKRPVVTNDITFGGEGGFYILTGANNGGKTTFVRAVGVCQILAQAGFFVPAEECELSVCDCIYTHFPKEEQKGIDASKFTSEIKQFKAIIDSITDRSLLLMNESLQSTTPAECVDIASRLTVLFAKRGVRGIFATHLIDVAANADKLNESAGGGSVIKSIVSAVGENGERTYRIKEGAPMRNSFADSVLKEFGIDV